MHDTPSAENEPVFCPPRLLAYVDRRAIPRDTLAAQIGITVEDLHAIERGTLAPHHDVLASLAEALSCTVDDFTTTDPNPTSHDHYWAVMWATADPMTPEDMAAIGRLFRQIDTNRHRDT